MFGVTDYTETIDIWSLGCIFYELIKKEPLFNCIIKLIIKLKQDKKLKMKLKN